MKEKTGVKDFVIRKLNKAALSMAEDSIESLCVWVFHQPKLDEAVKKKIKAMKSKC